MLIVLQQWGYVCTTLVLVALLLTVVGIGGVAAALTLGLRGHNVIVLESAPKVCM